MQEITKFINKSDFKKSKIYKQMYLWTIRRLPAMFFIEIISLPLAFNIFFCIFNYWLKSGIFLYQDTLKLLLFICYIFWFVPNLIFYVNLSKQMKAYPDTYEITFTKDGTRTAYCFIPWNKKKTIECKYGFAIISIIKIHLIATKNVFTDTEYEQIKLWMKPI